MSRFVAGLVGCAALAAAGVAHAAAPARPAQPAASAKAAPKPAARAPAKPAAKPRPAAPKPELVTAGGIFTREGLATLAFTAAGREKDAFDTKDLGRTYVGRLFLFSQGVADDDASNNTTNSFWNYDKTEGTMTFRFRRYASSLYLKYQSKKVGEYTARNTFGVAVRVKAYADTEAYLEPISSGDFDDFSVTVHVDPAEGRRLAQDVVLVVEGEIAQPADGKVTWCDQSDDDATIDDPVAVTTYACHLTGKVTAVSFYDTRRKADLGRWPAEPVTPTGGPSPH